MTGDKMEQQDNTSSKSKGVVWMVGIVSALIGAGGAIGAAYINAPVVNQIIVPSTQQNEQVDEYGKQILQLEKQILMFKDSLRRAGWGLEMLRQGHESRDEAMKQIAAERDSLASLVASFGETDRTSNHAAHTFDEASSVDSQTLEWNFSDYEAGDVIDFGERVVIGQGNSLTGFSDKASGNLKIKNIDEKIERVSALNMSFFSTGHLETTLIFTSGETITLKQFSPSRSAYLYFRFGDYTYEKRDVCRWTRCGMALRFAHDDGLIKWLVDDTFVTVQPLPQGALEQVQITGIWPKKTYIYELSIR